MTSVFVYEKVSCVRNGPLQKIHCKKCQSIYRCAANVHGFILLQSEHGAEFYSYAGLRKTYLVQ